MEFVESYRKTCLKQQTELRRIMESPGQFDESIRCFLVQHARLHSRQVTQAESWSLEDEVLKDISAEQVRRIPSGSDHSVAWIIWHIARCEDITMNLLVAGSPQVLLRDNWAREMKVSVYDTGNAMDRSALSGFSDAVDIGALRAYRIAVGRRTREIVMQLQPEDLKRKVDPARLQQVMDQGAVLAEARGIADYWGKRNVAGLLLMPATRHNLVHLTEALKLKYKYRRDG